MLVYIPLSFGPKKLNLVHLHPSGGFTVRSWCSYEQVDLEGKNYMHNYFLH